MCSHIGYSHSFSHSLTALDTLDNIPRVDHPEIRFNEHESTQMPFRYVTDQSGNPIMPEVNQPENWLDYVNKFAQGMRELIEKDADKALDDLI